MQLTPSNVFEYAKKLVIYEFGVNVEYATFLNFSVSNRCNARCQMCDIWKYPSDDLTGAKLRTIFESQTFSKVEKLGLTGGEPFIRKDFVDVVSAAVESLPRLKQIAITTNGFNTSRIDRYLSMILDVLEGTDIRLIVTISVDGVNDIHNIVRGVPGVWRKVEQTITLLSNKYRNKIDLSAACTIVESNASYESLIKLDRYMRSIDIPVSYRLAVEVDRIYNKDLIPTVEVRGGAENTPDVHKFVSEVLLKRELGGRWPYYEMISKLLSGDLSERNIKCMEMRDGGMLDSNGDLYVCSVSGEKVGNVLCGDITSKKIAAARAKVRKEKCNKCFHDHQSHKSLSSVFKIIAARIRAKYPRIFDDACSEN